MADEITIGAKAIKEIQALKDELLLADQALIKLSQNALNAGKNLSNISTPSGLNKAGEGNAKTIAELEALKTKYASLSDTIVKKAEQSRLAEIKLQQQREKAFDSFEKNAKKEEAIVNKNTSLYNKTQQQINNLTKAYNDLSVKKERYGSLTANEEMRLKTLQTVTEKYNGVLKNTDAQIGKNQRNVGNYASGYNALGNSISQLSREMPAFANSVQTGLMAISNNVGAFQDAIMNMRAAGMSWGSIMKEMGSSLFGLTGIVSLATTLLVVMGPEIWDWITANDKAKESIDALNISMERNNTLLENVNKNISHQSILAIENAKQRGATADEISRLEKKAVEDQLNNFRLIESGLKKQLDNADSFRKAQKEGTTNAWFDRMRAEKKGAADIQKIQNFANEELYATLKNGYNKARNATIEQGFVLSELTERQQTEKVEKVKKNNEKFNSEVLKVGEKFAKKELEALAESDHDKYRLLVKQSFLELDLAIKSDSDKIKQMEISEEQKQMLLLTNAKNAIIARRNISDAMIAEEKKLFTKESAELKNLTKGQAGKTAGIKDVNKSSSDALKALEKQQQAIEKTKKSMEELQQSTTNWLGSFSSEFLQNSGFGSLETFFDGTFKKLMAGADTTKEKFAVTFNAIAESAQEAFNFISNTSQKNFDREKERLQNQYDTSLKYVGDNKEAQTKLAEDLEIKKKEIANREAKAKQKQAIFNIAIDTAQAIIGLWANPGFPAAIPLALIVGALGLAQIAAVSSQEIPQYWMGGTHDGGLMMVNDGKGSNYKETIVTPDGKIMKPQGRNVIMDAPIGTEIFTHDQWNEQMNNMLQGNGINWNMPQQNNNYGISKADMRDAMLEAIGEQPQYHSNFDANGATDYIMKKGNITRSASKRGNSTKTRFT